MTKVNFFFLFVAAAIPVSYMAYIDWKAAKEEQLDNKKSSYFWARYEIIQKNKQYLMSEDIAVLEALARKMEDAPNEPVLKKLFGVFCLTAVKCVAKNGGEYRQANGSLIRGISDIKQSVQYHF